MTQSNEKVDVLEFGSLEELIVQIQKFMNGEVPVMEPVVEDVEPENVPEEDVEEFVPAVYSIAYDYPLGDGTFKKEHAFIGAVSFEDADGILDAIKKSGQVDGLFEGDALGYFMTLTEGTLNEGEVVRA